jgi:hypothetical protein
MKTQYKKLVFIFVASIVIACSKDNVKQPSKEELLTANSSKSWNITFSSDDADETDVSCKEVNAYTADNAWTFKIKGEFEFSNGDLYEIANCDTCQCTDAADLVGNWTLSKQDTLSIIVNGVKESNGSITPHDPMEIVRGKITSISEKEIILGDKTATYLKLEPK